MKLIEITQKYFSLSPGVEELLEAYSDPENELYTEFSTIENSRSTIYYKCVVREKISNNKLLLIDFELSSATPNNIYVGNVRAMDDIPANKVVHTTAGSQITGSDIGHTAIKWVYKKIKEFSKTKGFDIKTIKSTNRYTGARAKNRPNPDGNIDSFSVNAKATE